MNAMMLDVGVDELVWCWLCGFGAVDSENLKFAQPACDEALQIPIQIHNSLRH